MAEILLLEETTFESASNPPYGYSHIIAPTPFVLEIGAEYRAVFDGIEYPCTGLDASPLGTGAVGIGNGAAFGLPGGGEPFCAGTFGGAAIIVCLLDTEPTDHSIAVYKVEKETGLVTENYDGSINVFPGVESVSLDNTEGGTETFVHESLVAEPVEATVDVDWSGGDMIVTPEVGKVFSSILIPRPKDAMQENILEGKNIGGILGTLVAGGGGDVKVAVGTFTATAYTYTITTNHGFKPDFIFAVSKNPSETADKPFVLAGFSSALIAATGTTIKNLRVQRTSTMLSIVDTTDGIEGSTGNIRAANETGFRSGTGFVSTTWAYVIIGGLT